MVHSGLLVGSLHFGAADFNITLNNIKNQQNNYKITIKTLKNVNALAGESYPIDFTGFTASDAHAV